MSTYRVDVVFRDGSKETVFAKSGLSRGEFAVGITRSLADSKVSAIKHTEGVLIAVNPISVEVS